MIRAKFFALPLIALSAVSLAVPAAQALTDAEAASNTAQATVAEAEAAAGAMETGWTIVQNTTSSPEHQTLTQAISAAGLVDTLNGSGPYTVFAPTDAAFATLPANVTSYLMDPANKELLAKVLSYHVVPGKVTAEDLYAKIKAGGGKATMATVAGETLTFTEAQGNIKVEGMQGSVSFVTQPDVEQSNGVIHVVNGVLIPTFG